MLRLLLPPNLAAAATRDAIAVRVELDLSVPPPPELLAGLAVLQRIGVKPQPISLVPLKRRQLAEVVQALKGQPVFFWLNQPNVPMAWSGERLSDVADHLIEAPAAPPKPLATPAPVKSPPRKAIAGKPASVDGSEHFLAIALPGRESPLHLELWELLKAHGFVLEPSNGKFWLRDRHKTLNFLARHWDALRDHFHAEFSENFQRNTAAIRMAEATATATESGDGYDLALGLSAGAAPEAAIAGAIATSRSYVADGSTVYLIRPEQVATLQRTHQALAGSPEAPGGLRRTHRISRARVAEAEEIVVAMAPHFQPPGTWRQRSEALRHLERLTPAPVPADLERRLRPYQKLGVAWLWFLLNQGLGGILADEMGLGKTLQALALLSARISSSSRPLRPSLVVCPASLMENWRREAARFAQNLRTLVHHGSERQLAGPTLAVTDLVITSYGTLARDDELFAAAEFDLIIADEAQHLKNRRTQAARSLRLLRGAGRFLLTGTPLENALDDLRSLFEFLMPGYLSAVPPGTRPADRAWYDERLRRQAAPYILRRTKAAVAPELPAKIEQVIHCEFSGEQAALYRRVQQTAASEVQKLADNGASDARLRLAMFTELLRLRQVCCDPRLLPGAADSKAESAKLEAFRELLDEIVDEGHRVLVFSQFTSLLELLRTELEREGVTVCQLDGSMSPRARQAEVDRFAADASIPVLLISLKAGGTGLNLTAADTVVHYDPWWNPAAEAQATDRAHRIGQTRVVTSYRLICAGTVEEKVLALQESKRALLADVFEASEEAAGRFTLTELRDLLT
ncbi:MAG TPA: DEAD/DEAH box helicase [Candidatus Didemnitutus sp.]|nr:DEAD/DEAH box helicase [Candidatus Didemnitutus sp.]